MLGKLVEGLLSERFATDGGTTVVVECRRCGTSLDEGVDVCPYCGETETVRFEI